MSKSTFQSNIQNYIGTYFISQTPLCCIISKLHTDVFSQKIRQEEYRFVRLVSLAKTNLGVIYRCAKFLQFNPFPHTEPLHNRAPDACPI